MTEYRNQTTSIVINVIDAIKIKLDLLEKNQEGIKENLISLQKSHTELVSKVLTLNEKVYQQNKTIKRLLIMNILLAISVILLSIYNIIGGA